MTGPAAAVQATRLAVRRTLAGRQLGPVLVACSGGADSLALLAAAVFECREHGPTPATVVGAVVDHALQDDSADHTSRVVAQMAEMGAAETASVRVRVDAGPAGVEAGAREARYAALSELARHFEQRTGSPEAPAPALVLLGHTRDDQAETVLLGLTRGSGGRSVSGMRRSFGEFHRPFLDLTRQQTEEACREQGLAFWTDPHNADPRFTRSRVRHEVLPTLERELGPGVAAALARTGEMLREDLDALDDQAAGLWAHSGALAVDLLRGLPQALATRVVRLALIEHGAPPSDLSRGHVLQVLALEAAGPGTSVDVPGGLAVVRRGELLEIGPR